MKISKNKLKQIILEEINNELSEISIPGAFVAKGVGAAFGDKGAKKDSGRGPRYDDEYFYQLKNYAEKVEEIDDIAIENMKQIRDEIKDEHYLTRADKIINAAEVIKNRGGTLKGKVLNWWNRKIKDPEEWTE